MSVLALSLPCSAAASFAGLWDSTYGRLRLTQDGARVMPFAARASGKAGDDGGSFRFVEPRGGAR